MGSLEEKFIAVCDDYLSSRNGYDIRGDQGLFSFAMIIWLGIQQRLSGYSLRSSLNELASRALHSGGIGFLVGRTNQKICSATISTNSGGLARARERISVEDVRGLFQASTELMVNSLSAGEAQDSVYVLDGAVVTTARSASNLEYFCPTGNGMGELHYPKVRVISAHEVSSGIAREVVVGSWRDSEVALSQNTIRKKSLNDSRQTCFRTNYLCARRSVRILALSNIQEINTHLRASCKRVKREKGK